MLFKATQHDFLLAFLGNYFSTLHRFQDITKHQRKITRCSQRINPAEDQDDSDPISGKFIPQNQTE